MWRCAAHLRGAIAPPGVMASRKRRSSTALDAAAAPAVEARHKRRGIKTDATSDVKAETASSASVGTRGAVHPDRVRPLNSGSVAQGPVIYWLSRDQRVKDNWALLYAAEQATRMGTGLAVAFNLVPSFLGASGRHFGFMLRGLKELDAKLSQLRIPFFLLRGEPKDSVPELMRSCGAGLLVTDFSPLRIGKQWRREVANIVSVAMHEVDAHNVVPCWITSTKREYAARTIRPKARVPDVIDWDKLIRDATQAGCQVPEVDWFTPGEDAAHAALMGPNGFLTTKRLTSYDKNFGDPSKPWGVSNLSPYLHFGQLSAQRAALEASKLRKRSVQKPAVDRFLEQLIVRRELADNFCEYTENYDSLAAATAWARESLIAHQNDPRDVLYTREQLEGGYTHDKLWNASQLEMVHRGKMHGFMRLYWAKRILEWTSTASEAIELCIYLNDKYELDGRDPNGYVGIMWSITGIHDRAWMERPVFGKVRFMSLKGCQSKFDVPKYIAYVETLVPKAR